MGGCRLQVSEVVLQQLEDTSGDISGLAVKWWAGFRARGLPLGRAASVAPCLGLPARAARVDCLLGLPSSLPLYRGVWFPVTAVPAADALLPRHCSLGFLVNKNRDEQLAEVVAALCNKLLTGSKEQLRAVASLGLKTVVAGEARLGLEACDRLSGCRGRSVSRLAASDRPSGGQALLRPSCSGEQTTASHASQSRRPRCRLHVNWRARCICPPPLPSHLL